MLDEQDKKIQSRPSRLKTLYMNLKNEAQIIIPNKILRNKSTEFWENGGAEEQSDITWDVDKHILKEGRNRP